MQRSVSQWPEARRFFYYDANGRQVGAATYRHGVLEGAVRWWGATGTLVSLDTYLHGKRHGPSREWDISGDLQREEQYANDVLQGSFNYKNGEARVEGSFENGVLSGRWTWFPCGVAGGTITGQWRDGLADGHWKWCGADGEQYLSADIEGGRVMRVVPPDLSPRILEAVVGITRGLPLVMAVEFRAFGLRFPKQSQAKLVRQIAWPLTWNFQLDMSGLGAASVPDDLQVPLDLQDEPVLLAYAKALKPYGVGFDLRNGTFVIDSLDSIANWRDKTDVTLIVPPAGSKLDDEWHRQLYLDVIESPLRDVIQFLSDLHSVQFDTSRLVGGDDETATSLDTLVTTKLEGHRFKDTLAILLDKLGLKASLEGETIVIEPQE